MNRVHIGHNNAWTVDKIYHLEKETAFSENETAIYYIA